MNSKQKIKENFNSIANSRIKWKKRNRFYHKCIEKYYSFIIPKKSKVLDKYDFNCKETIS